MAISFAGNAENEVENLLAFCRTQNRTPSGHYRAFAVVNRFDQLIDTLVESLPFCKTRRTRYLSSAAGTMAGAAIQIVYFVAFGYIRRV